MQHNDIGSTAQINTSLTKTIVSNNQDKMDNGANNNHIETLTEEANCYIRPAPPVKNRVIPTVKIPQQKNYNTSDGRFVMPADEQQDVLVFKRF